MEEEESVWCENCGKQLKPGDFAIVWQDEKRVAGTIKKIEEEEISDEEEFEIEYLEKITLDGETIESPDAVFCSPKCEEEFTRTMVELFEATGD